MEKTLLSWAHDLNESPRNTILFLDEMSQTMSHLLVGGTEAMPKIRKEATKALEMLVSNPCVTVIAAESGLGDPELEWLKEISGTAPRVLRSTFTHENTLHYGKSAKSEIDQLEALTEKTLKKGQKVWGSMGKKLTAKRFSEHFKDKGYKVLLITSASSGYQEVVKFMANTEKEGPEYDLVVFSPSVTSGISMAETKVGLAFCIQEHAMGPEDALQALGRARRADLRVLLLLDCASQAAADSQETTYEGVLKKKNRRIEGSEHDYLLPFFEGVNTATSTYAIKLEARQSNEAYKTKRVLMSRLRDQGYVLEPLSRLFSEADSEEVKGKKIAIAREAKEITRTIKEELLGKLIRNEITLGEANKRAAREAKGGLIVDYEKATPRLEWEYCQLLEIQGLVQAGSFDTKSFEFKRVEAAVHSLGKKEARELRQVLGGRVEIPGPDDEVKPTFIKAVLKMAGMKVIRKRMRVEGERHYSYTIK